MDHTQKLSRGHIRRKRNRRIQEGLATHQLQGATWANEGPNTRKTSRASQQLGRWRRLVRKESEIQTARSERDYHTSERGFDRRIKCTRRNLYDDRGPDMVAAGFPDDREGRHRDDRR